jgi:hypothetical protein
MPLEDATSITAYLNDCFAGLAQCIVRCHPRTPHLRDVMLRLDSVEAHAMVQLENYIYDNPSTDKLTGKALTSSSWKHTWPKVDTKKIKSERYEVSCYSVESGPALPELAVNIPARKLFYMALNQLFNPREPFSPAEYLRTAAAIGRTYKKLAYSYNALRISLNHLCESINTASLSRFDIALRVEEYAMSFSLYFRDESIKETLRELFLYHGVQLKVPFKSRSYFYGFVFEANGENLLQLTNALSRINSALEDMIITVVLAEQTDAKTITIRRCLMDARDVIDQKKVTPLSSLKKQLSSPEKRYAYFERLRLYINLFSGHRILLRLNSSLIQPDPTTAKFDCDQADIRDKLKSFLVKKCHCRMSAKNRNASLIQIEPPNSYVESLEFFTGLAEVLEKVLFQFVLNNKGKRKAAHQIIQEKIDVFQRLAEQVSESCAVATQINL